MNKFKLSNRNRPLKPEWLLKPGPWKTLHDKGIDAYLEETKVLQEKQKIIAKEQEKIKQEKRSKRFNYLMSIEHEQGNDKRMWPYDLAKMMASDENTLQMCREDDHLFDYKREHPDYEYNPENYYLEDEYDYPDYDGFCDFIDDYGEDYSEEYNNQLLHGMFQSTLNTTGHSYSIAPVFNANK